jgi:hypothetical protein
MQIIFACCKNALAYYNDGDVVGKSEVIGLAPGFTTTTPALASSVFSK